MSSINITGSSVSTNVRIMDGLVFAYDCGNTRSFPYPVGSIPSAFPNYVKFINMMGGIISSGAAEEANLTASLELDSRGYKHLFSNGSPTSVAPLLENRSLTGSYVIADDGVSRPFFDAIMTSSKGFTIETIISTSVDSANITFMFGNGTDTGNEVDPGDNVGFLMGLFNGRPAAYMSYSSSGTPNRILLRNVGSMVTGSWAQITYTWNGNWGGNGTGSLYLNGDLLTFATRSNSGYFNMSSTSSTDPLFPFHGKWKTWGWRYSGFQGYQDSLFIYNKGLTAEEVKHNFNIQRRKYNL
jgi:hypothetical protein